MRKGILFLVLCLYPLLVKADVIEDLTKEQAEMLRSYVLANPILIEYCDCCDKDIATLFMLDNAYIEPSSYDASLYVVKYIGNALYNVNYAGANASKVVLRNEKINVSGTLNINYFFGHVGKGKAKPLGHIIGLAETPSCIKEIAYPTDAQAPKSILNLDYKAWYTKHTKGAPMANVMDFYNLMDGNWFTFTKIGGQWLSGPPSDEEPPLEASVDFANGLLQFGGEGYSQDFAIFKLQSGKYLVGQVDFSFDGALIECSIRFLVYEGYWKDVTTQVFPSIGVESFMKQGFKMPENHEGFTPTVTFDLNKDGAAVSALFEEYSLKRECEEDKLQTSCAILNQLQYRKMEFSFNNAGNGSFVLKSKK